MKKLGIKFSSLFFAMALVICSAAVVYADETLCLRFRDRLPVP